MRSEKVIKNIIASLLLQIVVVSAGFILPRLYIQTYGSEVNGMISSIKQFLIYLSLVEGGIAAAAIAALYSPIAKGDSKKINGILSATQIFYKKLGVIFLFLLFLTALLFSVIVAEDIEKVLSFFMVLILGVGAYIEYFILGKYKVVLTAYQKNYIISNIQLKATILNTILIVILIKLDFSILAVQFLATTVYVFRIIKLKKYILKNHPNLNFEGKAELDSINQKWSALIHQLSSLIVFNSPIIILTVFTDLKEVSVYSIYLIVFSGIQMFISSFTTGLVAAFGDVLASNNEKLLKKAFREFEHLFYMILFIVYTCSYLLIDAFIFLYTEGFDDANYQRPLVGALFVLMGIANNIRIPSNIIVTSAGHFKETKNRALTEAFINVAASIFFTIHFGLIGVLIGGLISYLYRTIDFIIYTSKKILNQTPYFTFIKLIFNTCISLSSLILINKTVNLTIETPWEWIQNSILFFIIISSIMFLGNLLLFPKSTFALILRVKNIMKSLLHKLN